MVLFFNPFIEKYEFLNCTFLQNCGDTLKVLEKLPKGRGSTFKCEFQTYKCILLADKKEILLGHVKNPEIENQTFIGKVFKQFCNDSLKVIRKNRSKG